MGAQIRTLHDIGPAKGPARKMAEFITSAIADTSDFDRPDTAPGPACFKCRKRDNHRVATAMPDDAVVWHCPACGIEGIEGQFGVGGNTRCRPLFKFHVRSFHNFGPFDQFVS